MYIQACEYCIKTQNISFNAAVVTASVLLITNTVTAVAVIVTAVELIKLAVLIGEVALEHGRYSWDQSILPHLGISMCD